MDEGDARAGVRRVDPDSRARTHLANERTFLAWLRTGLSLIALGLAAAQFLGRNLVPSVRLVTILSVLLVTGGVALTIVAGVRYARTRDGIDAGPVDHLCRRPGGARRSAGARAGLGPPRAALIGQRGTKMWGVDRGSSCRNAG